MKSILLFLCFVALLFTSCSQREISIVSSDEIVTLSRSTLDNDQPLESSDAIVSAKTFSSGFEVLEYNKDNVHAWYPCFSNEFADKQIKIIMDENFNSFGLSDSAEFDFYISYNEDAVSYIFYNSKSLSSFTRNLFSITFTSDYTKVLSLSDFIKAKAPLKHIEDTVNLLYGKTTFFKDGANPVFYVNAKGVVVIDSLGERFVIPRENYIENPTRRVTVGDDYEPVINRNEKVIALTFDDGPNYKTTSALLKMLKEKEVKATFFTVGYNIPGNEHLLNRMVEQGCDVGIHSFAHSNYYTMSHDDVNADIEKCADLIKDATDTVPYLVRAPFGNAPDEIVKEKRYFFINWNIDPYDWLAETPEEISDHIINHAYSGRIILLHDIYNKSCEAAELVIDKLKADGWRFVTISELFDLKDKEPSGKIYYGLGI